MRRVAVVAMFALLAASRATAADISGAGALALAGIVAENTPQISVSERNNLASFLNGKSARFFPARKTIQVLADSIECKASNVAIVERSCLLKFGGKSRTITGRKAHELYATLVEVGVTPEGAAGSAYASAYGLDCAIQPAEVRQNSGGGATCRYDSTAK
jgi:hypothetical protein